MGLWLVGRRPVFSKGGYSHSPDLKATFTFVCPRHLLHLQITSFRIFANTLADHPFFPQDS
jgi:hypothetical protein